MTLRVSPPEGTEPVMWLWRDAVPGIGPAATALSDAVYGASTLPLREFEAARTRIAQINHCQFCLDWRTQRDGDRVDEAFYGEVERWRDSAALSERERLAAELAERFAIDHLSMDTDEAFWARLRGAYSDAEIIELTMCIGSWVLGGRINHVFGLDTFCVLPANAHAV
jgi:alkylhydroperoxidase family enzyme